MSNKEGYPDPTADVAIAHVMREQKMKQKKKVYAYVPASKIQKNSNKDKKSIGK